MFSDFDDDLRTGNMMSDSRLGYVLGILLCFQLMIQTPLSAATNELDLSEAVLVVAPGTRGPAEKMAEAILVEEIQKRTGIKLETQQDWLTTSKTVIAISSLASQADWANKIPGTKSDQPEGFSIQTVIGKNGQSVIYVTGADSRGAMFGVGRLLRELHLSPGKIKLNSPLDMVSSPEYPLRGHELGYRARANSYDAWSKEQYEQYIRDHVVFGMNCIQGIPFQDDRTNKMMKYSRAEMNKILGEICEKYDLDYWVWTPVEFDLNDQKQREAELKKHAGFYRDTPRLDAVFVPGGDPGENAPELVIPFMEDLAKLLESTHPKAKVWVSLQDFDEPKIKYVMDYIKREQPDWFGGIVADTSALPVGETRRRLPKKYPVSWYPDITHNVICQFPVSWWDPAYALTLGREATNPRPVTYANIFRRYAPYTGGFATYSDGMHDDVNKMIWSTLGWNAQQDTRELLIQYSRYHFGEDVAEQTAGGILGLETNWRGSLAENASVDGVLALWQKMESEHPELLSNWRFQQNLMRACYDAYTRQRLIYETQLEQEAMQVLAQAEKRGPSHAIKEATSILNRAVEKPCRPELRKRIDELAAALFQSIGYQTSSELHGASGAERGAVMDFVERPLNNRWWLEDEFARIRDLKNEADQFKLLEVIQSWENPGRGSYYDDIGHVGKSPHVMRGEGTGTDPERRRHSNPGHAWENEGLSRWRLSWLHGMRWPEGLHYDGLDPNARYVIRLTGGGKPRLRADGKPLAQVKQPIERGQFLELKVPPEAVADGVLRITFDAFDESKTHYTKRSRVNEVWLLRR